MGWWRRLRYRTCSVCGAEFRKHTVVLPSLVGYSYCSTFCEARAWAEWTKGATS